MKMLTVKWRWVRGGPLPLIPATLPEFHWVVFSSLSRLLFSILPSECFRPRFHWHLYPKKWERKSFNFNFPESHTVIFKWFKTRYHSHEISNLPSHLMPTIPSDAHHPIHFIPKSLRRSLLLFIAVCKSFNVHSSGAELPLKSLIWCLKGETGFK